MNFQEISQFVGAWQQTGMYEQRMGWLYGYYSEDPNFASGVRANVEAIYEPPQVGDVKGVQALDDPFRTQVDLIAEGLSLERVGFIFTSLALEDAVLFCARQPLPPLISRVWWRWGSLRCSLLKAFASLTSSFAPFGTRVLPASTAFSSPTLLISSSSTSAA